MRRRVSANHGWLAALAVGLALAASPARAQTFDLVLDETSLTADGQSFDALAINGSVPGPTLNFIEGEVAVINVQNNLDEPASLHWHGLLVPARMDGVPGLNGFTAIPPGGAFTYRFRVRQSGTYWYHSHSLGQEQMGIYGAIVVTPKDREPVKADRDYVVLLSDATPEHPDRILRNLKVDPGYYNNAKRTLPDFIADAEQDGVGNAIDDRLAWGEMRMDPTDLADVTGYTFLVNGKGPADNWTGIVKAGERVRLRVIDGSAMSIFDVRIPGAQMIVIAADGQNVQPVPIDEFRIAPGETYDVVVVPKDDTPLTFFAEAIDRTGFARATLAPRAGMTGEIPAMRPRALLTMSDMGAAHDMNMRAGHAPATSSTSADHAAMDHSAHDMAAMQSAPETPSEEPKGWAAGAPGTSRVLSYADLKSATPHESSPAVTREITMHLGGSMERYIWTLDGVQHHDAQPIKVKHGDRVRIKFVNETMMAHPMHLHGMFFELEQGDAARYPKKHTVMVPPGQSVSVLLTADEFGKWALHCHLLFHMLSGMMTELTVLDEDGEAPPWY